MSVYKIVGTAAVAPRTMLIAVATTTIRPRLLDYTASHIGAIVLDSNWQLQGRRLTAVGTTTALTPAPTDPNDPAATLIAGSNATVEPTYTANTTWEDIGINPRSTFRWIAYEQREEIIMPALAGNGIGFILSVIGGAINPQVKATVSQ